MLDTNTSPGWYLLTFPEVGHFDAREIPALLGSMFSVDINVFLSQFVTETVSRRYWHMADRFFVSII